MVLCLVSFTNNKLGWCNLPVQSVVVYKTTDSATHFTSGCELSFTSIGNDTKANDMSPHCAHRYIELQKVAIGLLVLTAEHEHQIRMASEKNCILLIVSITIGNAIHCR
jgi:hypothetical protein